MGTTHHFLQTEQFFALLSQLHRRHADFPATITPPYFLPQRAADDLVTKTDPDQSHSALLKENLLGESNQLEDPDVVVEGVETCIRWRLSAQRSCNSNQSTRIHPSSPQKPRLESDILTTPTKQHNIHILQIRVQLLIHNIILPHIQLREIFVAVLVSYLIHAFQQQLLEQIAVTAIFLPRVADGDVAFQDRYAERRSVRSHFVHF
jgi:hypothetical protein